MESLLFVMLSVFAGILLPMQAAANAQLSKAIKSPFVATTLQLGIGAILLVLAATLTGSLGAISALKNVHWWHALGGIASAIYVIAGILLIPRLGAIVTVGLFIAGQVITSLMLDTLGLLGVSQHALQFNTIIGVFLVMTGVLCIVKGQPKKVLQQESSKPGMRWLFLGLVAGALLPIQGAVNALLRTDLGAPLAVAVTSFVVAMLAMATALIIVLAVSKAHRLQPTGALVMPWWGWLGGLAGAIYVTTVFTAMPVIGAAATVGLTVAGQQVASVVVDRYGLLQLPKIPVNRIRLLGVASLLIGVISIKGV